MSSSLPPAAVASVQLSEDERKRIASELGLDESQLDAVPTKLDIARFDVEEEESDVEGFAMNAFVMRGAVQPKYASKIDSSASLVPQMNLGVGKIPGAILVAQ